MKSVFVRARLKRLLFSAFLLPLLMPHAFGAQPEPNANSEPVRTVSCAENIAGGGICFVNTSCLDPNLTYKVIYSDPNSPETFSSLIAQGLLETVALSATTPQFLYICGKVNVDVAPYVFAAGSEIIFSTNGSGFNVLSSADLTLERTYVHGCEKLWESIAVQSGGILAVLSGSRIEDAVAAIDLLPNAWLVSINSTYDGNYTAIKASNLGSGPNSVSFANFLVYCNLFSGAKALLEPYTITSGGSIIGTVTTPYYGIVMINVSHVQIGFGTYLPHRNIFRDFTPSISGGGLNPPIPTGIDGTNSNITALNNQFINIGVPNVNEGRGVYFISPGSASSTLHFTGLGKNLTTTPTFETCQVGIEGLGNMQISESYFTDLLFGIYLNGTTDPYSIGIENNRFDIVREETIITNNITTLSKLVISGNDFIDNDPYLGVSGFSRTAVSLRTFVPGTQTTLVKENRFFNESKTGTFNFNYRGVWVNNQDGTAIIDNDFYDNFSGTSNTYWGVYGNNATTWVWDNYFRGAGNFSVHPAFATQFIESPDCQLFCNTAHLTKIGFDFKGNNCDNAYLQKNIFNTHDASLRLQSDAIIGLQSRRENKWVGSTSPVEALFMGRDPFNLLDQLHISFSRFLINDPNLLSDYWPNPILVGITNDPNIWFLQASGNPSGIDECLKPEEPGGGGEEKNLEEPSLTAADEAVLNGTFPPHQGYPAMFWEASFRLMNRLATIPELMPEGSPAVSFYLENENGTLGRLASVYRGIKGMKQPGASQIEVLDQNYAIIKQSLADLAAIDYAIASGEAMAAYAEEREEVLETLQNATLAYQNTYDEAKGLETQTAQSLLSALDEVAASNAWEEDLKTVFRIILETYLSVEPLEAGNRELLEGIAEKCRYANGFATLQARASLGGHTDYSGNDECPDYAPEGFGLPGAEVLTAGEFLTIYPNPATEETVLSFSRDYSSGEARLLQADGRLVTRWSLQGDRQTKLPLNGILPGMYWLSVTTDDAKPVQIKLIVH